MSIIDYRSIINFVKKYKRIDDDDMKLHIDDHKEEQKEDNLPILDDYFGAKYYIKVYKNSFCKSSLHRT